MRDVAINKIQSIQRCVERALEEYTAAGENFGADYTRQDAAILNIVRSCEFAIDLANHIVKSFKMGIPTSSAESFDLLQKKSVIDAALAEGLKKMTSFRNVVVHDYKKIDIEIVRSVITKDIKDLITFTEKTLDFIEGHKT